jgi:SAM-dependent methyltransferase
MSTMVENHFLRRGRGPEFEMEAAWLARHLPATASFVLEVGCGIGSLFAYAGAELVCGLDFAFEGLLHTQAAHSEACLVCGAAEQLPFADNSIDVIIAQHIIEHLENVPEVCAHWFAKLAPEGQLIVMTPNRAFVDPSVYYDESHVSIMDADELAGALRGAGYEIDDLRSLGLPWFRKGPNNWWRWRSRRMLLRHAQTFSLLPSWAWGGQTLCAAARKPR